MIPHEPLESRIEETDSWIKIIQKRIYSNYITLAYSFIIGTYFCAFTLYVYLRLASIIFPERFIYRRACELLKNETIERTGYHYGSITVIFIGVTFLQVMAFFLLTISTTYINFERRYTNFMSMEDKLLLEIRYKVRKVMYDLIYPTFLGYSITSLIIFGSIFYMAGMRDEIVDTVSQVVVYIFDGCVLVYFIIFPLISFIWHPDMQCSFKRCCTVPSNSSLPSTSTAARLTSFTIITDDSNNYPLANPTEHIMIRTTTSL